VEECQGTPAITCAGTSVALCSTIPGCAAH
jgi:hypothetical protein